MAALIGTVKVPARIIITAGEGQHEIGAGDFSLDIEVTGSVRPTDSSHVIVTPDEANMRSSIAQALRVAADTIEQRDNHLRS